MTDEEKAEKYLDKKYLKDMGIRRPVKEAYLDGLAEGRKETCETHKECQFLKYFEKEKTDLKKENEELQELQELNKKLQWKVAENINLKAENEKLKQEIESWKNRCAEIYWDS